MTRKVFPTAMLAILMVAGAACGGDDDPGAWSSERRLDPPTSTQTHPICDEIDAYVLSGTAAQQSIEDVAESLARFGAITGAADALPPLGKAKNGESVSANLLAASTSLDEAGTDMCGTPTFAAVYVGGGLRACHGSLNVRANTATADDVCASYALPAFLPCWTFDDGYLPTDCQDGTLVQLRNGEWNQLDSP